MFVIGILIDLRSVAGDPAWLKPAKFAASIALFTATLSWLVVLQSSICESLASASGR
jgi:hypothetical protein